MRLTTSMAALLVGAAMMAIGLGPMASADPPATDTAITVVIEEPAPASYDCPYA